MMRSMHATRQRQIGRRTLSICTLAVAMLLGAGCAGVRRSATSGGDLETLRAEAAASPSAAEPVYQMALLHYGERRPEAALVALRQALDRDADYVPALCLLAKLLHDTGRSAEGLRYFRRREAAAWPEPVRLNLALLYADAGNTVQARKLLQGLTAGAWADAAHVNLAYLDLVDVEHLAARQRLEADRAAYRDAPEVLNNLALARLQAGDVPGAAKLLHDAAVHHPDFAPAQFNLALLLRHYLFDDEGAARAEAHFDALAGPLLADAALREFLEARTEDTAPRAATPDSAAAGGRR